MNLQSISLRTRQMNFAVRMFISYMAGTFLLISITFLIIHHFFIGVIAQQVENDANEMMRRFRSSLDYQISAMDNISNVLGQDYDIRLYSSVSTYDTYKIRNKLQRYARINQNLADIAILDGANGSMVSASGTTSIDDYFYLYYRFERGSEIPATILSAQRPVMTRFFSTGGSTVFPGEYFFYVLPYKGEKKILFTIDKKYFSDAVLDMNSGFNGYLCILDDTLSTMTELSLSAQPFPPEKTASVILRLKEEDPVTQLELGNGVYAERAASAVHAWSYCVLSDSSALYNQLAGSYLIYFFSLIGILLLGIVLSMGLSRFNSLPLRRMVHRILPQFSGDAALDDLHLITNAFENIRLENAQLAECISGKNKNIQQQLFQLLLVDALSGRQAEEELGQVGLSLQEQFCVWCIIDTCQQGVRRAQALAGRLFGEKDESPVFLVEMNQSHTVALILKDGHTGYKEGLEAALQSQAFPGLYIGIGNTQALEALSRSFRQSLTAAQMAVSLQKPLLFYAAMQKASRIGFYPAISQLRAALLLALRSIQPEEMEDCAKRYFSFLADKPENRYEYYNLYSELIILGEQTGFVCAGDAFRAAEGESADEMEQELRRLLVEICAHLESQKIHAKKQLKFEVADYLRANYPNSMLSVTLVAEHFGVSKSYLDRYFKEYFGSTLTVFLDEIRMEKATGLLRMSDDKVKDIVENVGYVDVNNFNRKFKRKYGMTPSQYRVNSRITNARAEN